MRLEVTRRAALAARALLALDRAPGRLKAAQLAERLGSTAAFTPQVLAPLVEQGWVRSDPGPKGGYALIVPLDSLSLLDVIEAVDGPTDTGRCVVEGATCSASHPCLVHDAWSRARHELVTRLAATPVSDIGAPAEPQRVARGA